MNIKEIIFLTDYSERSKAAYEFVDHLKAFDNIPVHFIHYFQFSTTSMNISEKQEEQNVLEMEKNKEMQTFIKSLNIKHREVKGDVAESNNEDRFADLKSFGKDNLFVMHSSGNFFPIYMQITRAGKAAFYAESPVLIIPERSNVENIDEVVFLEDFEKDDDTELDFSINLAHDCESKLTILHLRDVKDYERNYRSVNFDRLKRKTQGNNFINFKFIDSGMSKLEKLKEYIDQHQNCLIVATKRNKSIEMIKETLIYHLINETDKPCIIF